MTKIKANRIKGFSFKDIVSIIIILSVLFFIIIIGLFVAIPLILFIAIPFLLILSSKRFISLFTKKKSEDNKIINNNLKANTIDAKYKVIK